MMQMAIMEQGSDSINRSGVDIEVVPKHLLNAFIARR